MDDYAAYLAEEAMSDIAALHQFMILYKPNAESYHFFFEGEEDGLFYMPEARRYTKKALHFYVCGGKKNVIQARDDIKSRGYDPKACLFFVDRDYDDYLGTQPKIDEHTYITDSYSIENDICSIDAARVLLTDILLINQADPEFAKIEGQIKEHRAIFQTELRKLTSWILAAKDEGCKPNLQNTKGLKGIMDICNGRPEITKAGFNEFRRKVTSSERKPSLAAMIKWARRIKTENPDLWIRGKYCMWFFHKSMLIAIKESNSRREAAGGKAIAIHPALRDGKIFEILGGRIHIPSSLQSFYLNRLG